MNVSAFRLMCPMLIIGFGVFIGCVNFGCNICAVLSIFRKKTVFNNVPLLGS